MNKKDEEQIWLIQIINNFIKDFEHVKIEIEAMDMIELNQIEYLKGMAYAIGSILNTIKNYIDLFYEGDHDDILNLIDKELRNNNEGDEE